MWGIIPAAGSGTRIQPLAFSKELLPVGSRFDGIAERPRAVGEYLVERMARGGADRICFVISPNKSDILHYFASGWDRVSFAYVVQPRPAGLCDAIFRALPLIPPQERVVVGLPDTIWFPEDALLALPEDILSFLLFPVNRPELFDAVVTDAEGRVQAIEVKSPEPCSPWIWGAFKLPGTLLHRLYELWCERDHSDEYFGTLVNAFLAAGGEARGIRAGTAYVDVGTVHGYREAMQLLNGQCGMADAATYEI
jgi:glucose-1-phosphate thymidylyltransferase